MASAGRNGKTASFREFNARAYNGYHYSKLSEADKALAHSIVHTLVQQLGVRIGRCTSLYEIGNGGTLRTAPLGVPLLAPGARITITDIASNISALEKVRADIERGRRGDLGYWKAHQDAMGKADKRWRQAIAELCRRNPRIASHDITKAPIPPTDIRVEGHVLCSITDNPTEYKQAVENFYATMSGGSIAIRCFDVKSTGYEVAGYRYKGYPINARTVRAEAEGFGLTVAGVREFPFEAAGGAADGTASTLQAIGGAVLYKPF